MSKLESISVMLEDKEFVFEVGQLAQMSDGSVVIKYGNEILLATANMSDTPREGASFFPLMCDFETKYYASGKIKGSRFVKRETRPPETAILMARIIDRTLRPMFPKGMINETQVIVTHLQTDSEHSPGTAAITAASMAIQLAGLPIEAPVAAVRVGIKENGEFCLDPTYEEMENGDLDLTIAGSEDAILMVEAGANLISNEKMLEAFEYAHKFIKKLCVAQREFIAKKNIKQREAIMGTECEASLQAVKNFVTDEKLDAVCGVGKAELHAATHKLEEELFATYEKEIEEEKVNKNFLAKYLNKLWAARMRDQIFAKNQRNDGRNPDEIRPLSTEVGLFPRIHGSGVFNRGNTQVLSVLTIGGPGEEQLVDDPERAEYKKAYMHHYNFPPYSVGEVRPLRGTGRREIGHGALAERALRYVIPTKKDNFPYTLRVVSEILACNGSSSMASVCGSTLCLMDGGIPIKTAISGIAMGLVTNDQGDYKILTDIQAAEDFCGDMDLKVCGDENGLTALQMDIKLKGLKMSLLKEALEKAQIARQTILKNMKSTIANPRENMSSFAPRVESIKIDPEQIRVVIGKGGETIQGMCADYNVKIDIEDDGTVLITSVNQEDLQNAIKAVKDLTHEPEEGDVFENATVKSLKDFGAFVEFLPGREALVHISEISDTRVNNIEDVLKEGQKVKVKIIGKNKMGQLQLSIKQA